MLRQYKNSLRHARWLAAALCLGALLCVGAPAQAAQPAAPGSLVYLYPTPVTRLCAGQQILLDGWYKTGPNPLTRRVDGPNPAPVPTLTIDASADLGQVTLQSQPVYYDAAGSFRLIYTATQPGVALIRAAIGGSSAAVTLKVYQACKINYSFYAEVKNSFTLDSVSIAETYHFTASGVLTQVDPSDLANLRDDHAALAYNGQLDTFDLPPKSGITISKDSYTPAQGSAPAAVEGVFSPDGSSLQFFMTKSRLKAQSELIVKITSNGITADAPFGDDLENAIFSTLNQHTGPAADDHFIDGTVPAAGGSFSVKAPELDQVCDFLNQSPGFDCTVTAWLDLEIAGQ